MAQNGGIQYNNRDENWYFTKEELAKTPSTKHMDKSKELVARQQAASFIQDMGLRLKVSQVIINTSVVYMHRFYMHHSFKTFHRNNIATACIFLACKIEEQPIRIFEIVKVFLISKGQSISGLDRKSPDYLQLEERIKNHEILLLQTLGFEVAIDHPHHYLLKGTALVKMTRDIAQISYFMAHNSLLLTTMCLEYKPQTVACVCINLSCRWKDIVIPLSSENKHWWRYIDPNLTQEKLRELTFEFLEIIASCPSRLKNRIEDYCKNRTAPAATPPLPSSAGVSNSARSSSSLPDAKRARYSSSDAGGSSQETVRPYTSSQPLPARTYPHTAVSTVISTNSGYQHTLQQAPPVLKRELSGPPRPPFLKSYPSNQPDNIQDRQRKDLQQQQQLQQQQLQLQQTQYQQLPPQPQQQQQLLPLPPPQQQQQQTRNITSSYKIPYRDDTKRM